MAKIINFSEAAYIGLHGMILIARSGNELLNVTQIAERMNASRHHVAKVFQRLVKAGMLESTRGPSGGFVLKKDPQEVTFLEVFESIEGKLEESKCLNEHQICPFDKCIMNNIAKKISIEFRDYLSSQKLINYI
ncbi:MAG TPA: Rrf2 family transcriptional regulator [Bacteroidia bacterium]|nr:Rrf2 family transcriptional regulator [Sphingobacteriales bacterium]HPD65209.1 Rrf2 family transcriptional regulator [Bacteroidia bacterium]HRS58588.1 Rrf2 family transcriptional regulator [Bacteroidia bacterium]HRU68045.1 Rrf2 family transcriptional regulator [Bacteroidia bacterium]